MNWVVILVHAKKFMVPKCTRHDIDWAGLRSTELVAEMHARPI